MLSEGDHAPSFTLSAFIDGSFETMSLEDTIGEQIIILVFYPADFNPGCDEQSPLNDLDLFAMQPAVSAIGIGPDSVYSHRAFAEEFDLKIPLCSDSTGEVATEYGVAYEDEDGHLLFERAVYIIDLEGVVKYAWYNRDMRAGLPINAIQQAVADIGGDVTGVSRYEVAHAHYVEGRRTFSSAMEEYEDKNWMVARQDFEQADEEFTTAADEFATAGRFVEHDDLNESFELAGSKATVLWQASDWLAKAADAFSSGDGQQGQSYQEDAKSPLESARDLSEPLDPDKITVEDREVTIAEDVEYAEKEHSTVEAVFKSDDTDTAGGVDLDAVEASIGTNESEHDDEDDMPDTDAARRLREYAGVGMDIEDPDGADDDQIADALAEADEGSSRSGADHGTVDLNKPSDHRARMEGFQSDQTGSTADSSDANTTAIAGSDGDHSASDTDSNGGGVTESEIEEITESLQEAEDNNTDTSATHR